MTTTPVPRNTILCGGAREMLRTLPDACVQMACTSPPYFGLRAYLPDGHPDKSLEIGLEETPAQYIEKLVAVFREVRRVLRSDGILWCNLGDSFSDKQLMMMPARVAIALQEDGWILRQDVIWAKTNCLPESVLDRPTSAHEHVFLLAKSSSYFYDAEAIKEPSLRSGEVMTFGGDKGRNYTPSTTDPNYRNGKEQWGRTIECASSRNKRSVWPIASHPYSGAHFATFPEKLVEPCILAGSSPRACEHCNAPWKRVTVPTGHINKREVAHAPFSTPTKTDSTGWAPTSIVTNKWQPTCACPNSEGTGKCIVLDPFMGSGTTALVALQQGREYLGIELNHEYIDLIEKRLNVVQPVLWSA